MSETASGKRAGNFWFVSGIKATAYKERF